RVGIGWIRGAVGRLSRPSSARAGRLQSSDDKSCGGQEDRRQGQRRRKSRQKEGNGEPSDTSNYDGPLHGFLKIVTRSRGPEGGRLLGCVAPSTLGLRNCALSGGYRFHLGFELTCLLIAPLRFLFQRVQDHLIQPHVHL